MTRVGWSARVLLPALWLGSPACARYVPQPIDPASHVSAYRARSLRDSSLLEWVGSWAGPTTDRWNERRLALVALAQRADLERARRAWLAAGAGVREAGGRPAPGAQVEVE